MSKTPEEMPDNATDRPLVTFALIAYNQEKYIREAVEGAFSQTYEPLEIILSDDCSSDRTYEIMQEIATAYDGPLKVVLRQNSKNLGIGGHVAAIGNVASGEWIVMAAGDDISYPERTEKLMSTANSIENSTAIFSAYNPMSEGNIGKVEGGNSQSRITLFELAFSAGGIGKGAAYAYQKECFGWPHNLPDWIVSEDRVLPFRAGLLGHVAHCPEPLLIYRLSATESERTEKNDRLRAIKNPKHWILLRQQTESASEQKRISRLNAITVKFALRASEDYYSESKNKRNVILVKARYTLLRAVKKVVTLCNSTLRRKSSGASSTDLDKYKQQHHGGLQ